MGAGRSRVFRVAVWATSRNPPLPTNLQERKRERGSTATLCKAVYNQGKGGSVFHVGLIVGHTK